ncbi:transposase [Dyella tabacisoli]|uniref:Transposase n=1 Tax=Dyella tabacisoli TaxID=2282381 RepID=A0A369UL28_9GAMM|nr:transposase [Dyella tabacisoli]RDD80428.1 transposase [Dyella tabacisoli]
MSSKSRPITAVRYTPEFRKQVLTKLAEGQISLRQASREFGVSLPTLIKWRKENDAPASTVRHEPSTGADASLVSEVTHLRQEIARLREERDYLRRGIAYLAGVPIKE